MNGRADKGQLIAVYGNNIVKAWLYLVFVSACVAALIVFIDLKQPAYVRYAVPLVAALYLFFLMCDWRYFLYPLKFSAYSQGLDVSRIGFYRWEDCRLKVADEITIVVFLRDAASKCPKWNILPGRLVGYETFSDKTWGKGHDAHLLVMSDIIPPRFSYDSAQYFYEKTKPYLMFKEKFIPGTDDELEIAER